MSTTSRLYDRREVLAAAAGAAVVASLPFGSLATPALGAPRVQPLVDWSIDDQWGVVPRWDAIPCVPRRSDDARLAAVHPADVQFLA
ncbi:MAG TPA: hypothetical protein VMU03_09260 [Gammaproteobacteria bacterium]|nr:hypothetical protein [Gammaproteobacteria bacterium]